MGISFLNSTTDAFPDVSCALEEPNGLLAAGGDLSTKRLLDAYSKGIFPWYSEFLEDGSPSPILWWCPQPRCVMVLDELKISRSLAKTIRNAGFEVSCDQAFSEIISACATERIGDIGKAEKTGTWINTKIQKAYLDLHQFGSAHSIECWLNDELIGGLYGVSIGKMFFGESMFSRKSNASKVAFVYLCSLLKTQGSHIVDCQIPNPHLMSLGASEINLASFQQRLKIDCTKKTLVFPTNKQKAASACTGLL